MTDYDDIVRPMVMASQSMKVERFNSLLTGWIEKNWDVIDLDSGVGEVTVRLKELGAVPVGVSSLRPAIAYCTNKYPGIEFAYSKSEMDYLNLLKYKVDCVVMRTHLLGSTTDTVKRVVSLAFDSIRPLGILIINLDNDTVIDGVLEAFPGIYLEYKTAYKTDARKTYYFVVLKKGSGGEELVGQD